MLCHGTVSVERVLWYGVRTRNKIETHMIPSYFPHEFHTLFLPRLKIIRTYVRISGETVVPPARQQIWQIRCGSVAVNVWQQ